MTYTATYSSPLGNIRVFGNGEYLTGLYTEFWQKRHNILQEPVLLDDKPAYFKKTFFWLDLYFQGRDPGELPPINPAGTVFQQKVWKILATIPYGGLMTYGEIAGIISQQYGGRMSAQAVGGAVGANPIGIIIPCHRVIGKNLSLTGYAGGLKTKMQLLKLEGIDTNRLIMPKKSKFL